MFLHDVNVKIGALRLGTRCIDNQATVYAEKVAANQSNMDVAAVRLLQ